ncbi:hypothetical protein MKW98_032027 [Papaver atlanticum]|uniref:Pentatricopeptide repeat-containing protein n=1 Tax=Papaver atlanticum TaxID=357466 RepID=A0AAD4SE42_9MAGN|nr:hypothetical protein MKW98_032027 [Papaver atlanticum]
MLCRRVQGLDNEISWNAMISGYMRNGDVKNARLIFNQMPLRSVVSFTAMVSGYANKVGAHDQRKWIKSYIHKRNIEISASLGNALIDMFAKCGDFESAILMFNHMKKRCIITWASMVAGLAFNGQCKEALTLFDEMCEGKRVFSQMVKQFNIVPPQIGCMIDLLSRAGKLEEADTLYGQREMLDVVTKKILELEPSNPAYLVLTSNLNASIGQ